MAHQSTPPIRHVTVIGAGTMGAAIAGQMANAGIPVTLLDMVPAELSPEESSAGLTLESKKVRNRIVQQGFDRMIKGKPANLMLAENAKAITLGNLEDDFEAVVGKSDWIIEVIVERAKPKQALMERIENAAPGHAIVSSNTSGIPIHIISEGRGEAFKRRFLGTHFFNPPRYLHLLEVIPTEATDAAVVARVKSFAEDRLGKGVVVCKDTPNFIANRMISFIQSDMMEFAIENGYTVEEVDALTGPLIGRPRTGTFRLNDVVGVDIMALVGENLYEMIPEDESREILRAPLGSALMKTLVEEKLLGSKTGQGFYKTVANEKGKKTFWGLDLQKAARGEIDYVAPTKPRWSSVGEAKDLPLGERLRALADASDAAGDLIWHTLSRTMAYASNRVPEIADSIVDIDNAMRWGFGWELGLFETWDALGVGETVQRMEAEDVPVAPWVHEMLAAGQESFYSWDAGGAQHVWNPVGKRLEKASADGGTIRIAELRHRNRPLAENEDATLHDMGDGVMLLEYHSKMNVLGPEIFAMMDKAAERLHGNASGLVIGNEGGDFSAGANLLHVVMLAQSGDWQGIADFLRMGQNALMNLRRAPKPVVAAPHNRVLGGGVESCLAADRILAHAETYMGLVEMGVGIVPAWGGCKEMVRRHVSPHMSATNVNPMPYLRQIFETIGFAKVGESAAQSRALGFLAPTDRIVMNRDQQFAEAKREILHLNEAGYKAPVTTGNVYAGGKPLLASVKVEVYSLQQGGFISEHDGVIANWLGWVLCGGDLSEAAWMDEQYFLDLEMEAVLELGSTPRTQERMAHILQYGSPLRN